MKYRTIILLGLLSSTLCTPLQESRLITSMPFDWVLDLLINAISYLAIVSLLFLLRICFLSPKPIFSQAKCSFARGFLNACFVPDIEAIELPHYYRSADNCSRFGLRSAITGIQSCLGLNIEPAARTSRQHYCLLAICCAGLQISFVLWGIMQERIMTSEYDGQRFGISQFLVFCNRLMTVLILVPVYFLPLGIAVNPLEKGHRAPFFEYSFASISNILSSWCQYEALKYVSFPTQVLSKACKVIPVMIMGKFVQHRSYSWSEYATAGLLCVGLNMFLLSDPMGGKKADNETAGELGHLSGAFLLCGYILLDSFTANWQDRMFQKYDVSALQVMAGVNVWSISLTLLPLLQQGSLLRSLRFGCDHPRFCADVLLSATCSATGQVFIFLTIANFGPATFAIIATLRMGLSILISCILFSHPLSVLGAVGIFFVFASLFLRIYLRSGRSTKLKSQLVTLKTQGT